MGEEEKIGEILDFWFSQPQKWWLKERDFDLTIRNRFEADLVQAVHGRYDPWKKTARGTLALIILLDQFSRNMYRDSPKAFSQDGLALEACKAGMKKGLDTKLSDQERAFFYMPLMHSENLEDQKESLKRFASLGEAQSEGNKYALLHYRIIERFGRYPHRNKILGRPSTPEEIEFLKQPGSSF